MAFLLVSGMDYYTGKTYVYQGGYYASYGVKDQAKRYSSKKRAESAAKKLGEKVGYSFVVIKAD